jgi:hypothetical protein
MSQDLLQFGPLPSQNGTTKIVDGAPDMRGSYSSSISERNQITNGFKPVVTDEPEQTLRDAIAEMTDRQICRPSAWKVAYLSQDVHQDDGDKHA